MGRSNHVLDALPPLATTGVGSLPIPDAAGGARHAVRAYDVPFCPQLPALDGDMIHEWLGADPRRCGWSAGRDRERPAAWGAFLAALAAQPGGTFRHGRIVKLQVTGPVTLATALERAVGPAGSGGPGATPIRALARELSGWLAANAAEQIRVLRARGLYALLIVDEPGLGAVGGRTEPSVWDPLRNTGAAGWGLHVCGAVPWDLVRAAAPDVVSFDVVRHGLDDEARAALRTLVGGGTRIAWGVLDPVDPGDAAIVAGRAAACVAAVAADRSPADVAARSLLTPSCGTGMLDVAREHLVAAVLQAAATATNAALEASPTT